MILDLFSGAGGFSLGAYTAGFSSTIGIEIDEDLSSSYASNFPASTLVQEDVRSVDPLGMLRSTGVDPAEILGIVGGPPCQGFSVIGKRDPTDPRNTLIGEFFRFVREISPPFFVLENVPGLMEEPHKSLLDEQISDLHGSYRLVGPVILNASDFGAATNRHRVIVLGFKCTEVDPLTTSDLEKFRMAAASVRDAITDLSPPDVAVKQPSGDYLGTYAADGDASVSSYATHARSTPPKKLGTREIRRRIAVRQITGCHPTAHTAPVRRRFAKMQEGERDPISKAARLRWDAPGPTLRAGTGKDRGAFQSVRPIHPTDARVITVREAARIQGFPDWFVFHRTRWHSFRMIGNSVSPYLSSALLSALRERMEAGLDVTSG